MCVRFLRSLCKIIALLFPLVLHAQTAPSASGNHVFANRALATFGLVAIPDDTASFLSVNQTGKDNNSFRSSQFGGGVTLASDHPIFLEGYLGYQRYDPRFILSSNATDVPVRAKWVGLAAAGGVGYDFRLNDYWTFRPVLNAAIGRITSELNISAPFTAADLGADQEFLLNGSIAAGGLGGSLMLEYSDVQRHREVEFRLRQSYMKLKTIGNSSNLDAEANVITSSAWARMRRPIRSLSAFGTPVRSVLQGSVTSYHGDQDAILGTNWLAKVGVGIEVGNRGKSLPVRGQARVLLSYAIGENYSGYSVGLGFNF
jgi:hypothetical protein